MPQGKAHPLFRLHTRYDAQVAFGARYGIAAAEGALSGRTRR